MKKKTRWLLLVSAALLALAAVCLLRLRVLSGTLPSQQAAERWQGESEQSFSQISCYLPVDEPVGLNEIYTFRTAMLEEFHKAALDADGSDGLWQDAWSAVGKLRISGERGKADASCIAVGGDFFAFHPLRLLSGAYLHESDLMKDLVLLDEDLAWLLFGGSELQGLSVEIEGKPFVIGGVVKREQDSASRMAYTAGQGLYLSYEAYVELSGRAQAVTCYEAVMPEPVKGFAERVAQEHFKLGRGEVLVNSGRFGYGRLLGLLKTVDSRSMQSMGMIYPYWENAARVVEDRCMRLLLAALLALVFPAALAVWGLVRLLRRGKDELGENYIPRVVDAIGEAIRRRQRRSWEKKHGGSA